MSDMRQGEENIPTADAELEEDFRRRGWESLGLRQRRAIARAAPAGFRAREVGREPLIEDAGPQGWKMFSSLCWGVWMAGFREDGSPCAVFGIFEGSDGCFLSPRAIALESGAPREDEEGGEEWEEFLDALPANSRARAVMAMERLSLESAAEPATPGKRRKRGM